ncbi:hypothetical protein CWI36_0154p0020 [Hamiltosporidium magnivora]|uniref:Uncharacterized protein n=1 Tax=Hamiltosporidium magnivora TaxID=148818 RepID=A0A4Q9LJD6_9MICR|nr:hypothetical protein CWI36_0154p0020 [Hamiltosporidium magnivora]
MNRKQLFLWIIQLTIILNFIKRVSKVNAGYSRRSYSSRNIRRSSGFRGGSVSRSGCQGGSCSGGRQGGGSCKGGSCSGGRQGGGGGCSSCGGGGCSSCGGRNPR